MRGKAVTFLVDGRRDSVALITGLVAAAASAAEGCAVFDADAAVSSGADDVLAALTPEQSGSVRIVVPEPGSAVEAELSRFFMNGSGVLVVESLSTLYHLFSTSDRDSRSRKAAFAVAGLSWLARTGGKAAALIVYRRERVIRAREGGSMSDLADATVSVEPVRGGVLLRCERGTLWPGGSFLLNIP
jgi:hypothetical protein